MVMFATMPVWFFFATLLLLDDRTWKSAPMKQIVSDMRE
jgi:hypothetical protein